VVKRLLVAALIMASGLAGGWANPLVASAGTRGLANPPANRAFPFPASCYPDGARVYNASRSCTDDLLASINQAQAAEGVPGFVLPSNYFSLSVTRQMFVLINLERISRGVPPFAGLSPYLSAVATTAASHQTDPPFQSSYGPVKVWYPPSGGYYAVGGTWAGGLDNAAAAVFLWMYADGCGTGSMNLDCNSKGAGYGHRDDLLGVNGFAGGTGCTDCVAGAGYVSLPANVRRKALGGPESYDFIIVRPVQFPTPMVFAWDGDVLGRLPAGWE
jgi:hypothetical protein